MVNMKPRPVELVDEQDVVQIEPIADGTVPTNRFLKLGGAAGKMTLAGAGDIVAAVSNIKTRVDASMFEDYADGDPMLAVLSTTKPVIIEAASGVTSVTPGQGFVADTGGKAKAITSEKSAVLIGIELVTMKSVNYVRGVFRPGGGV